MASLIEEKPDFDRLAHDFLTRYQNVMQLSEPHRWSDPAYEWDELTILAIAREFGDCAAALYNAVAIKINQQRVKEAVQQSGEAITLSDAAKMLGVAQVTLRTQVKRGRLYARLIGKTWVTTRDEVERYRKSSLGRVGRPRKSE